MIRLLLLLSAFIFISANQAIASDFVQAIPGREFSFPRDHGKHPDFQTEWWYFTGNVDSDDQTSWGFQLTFFRRSMANKPSYHSSWAVRDVYPAHFAIADLKNKSFFQTEMISREGPGLAGAAPDDLRIHVKDWSVQRENDLIRISAREGEYAIDLGLTPLKPLTLHGDSGFSRKGDSEKQASYYYSFTRLKAEGTLTFNGKAHEVSGFSWMDHEFGSAILSPDQAGWDWFSLQLDDGTDIMLFHLRKKDGRIEKPFGTIVQKNRNTVDLAGKSILIKPTDTWTSPHTGAVYPSAWIVEIPDLYVKLEVTPSIKDQELSGGESTGIIYWEGAVSLTGMNAGKAVNGKGYVELTGYAHSLAGRL
jgi:predicted secreted hydrolase